MAKITRPDKNVQAFGSQATGTSRTIFGDTAQSDDLTANLNTAFFEGWNTLGVKPPRQWANAGLYTVSQLVSYLFQTGIAEWNTNQEYHLNSITVGSDGVLYRSLINDNIGNDPISDGGVNWNDIAGINDFVNLTTAQTIAGIKTFSSFPVTPSSAPTTDYQVANKKYVDDNSGLTSATTTEAQSQTIDTKAITPLKLKEALQGSNQSLASGGYQKLPGGLIIQWGQASTNATYSFPIAFPNACLTIAFSRVSGANGTPGVDSFTASQFVYRSLDIANTPGTYIAIGY